MSINGVITLPAQASPISALPPFGVNEIRKRTNALQEVMRSIMKEGTHYGTIPGTPKPSLWKSGAEVLCMTFRLAPMLESHVTVDDPEAEWGYQGHRRDGTQIVGTCTGYFEIEAVCTIHGPNGDILSRCSARCNNRENKYRSLGLFDIRNTILKMAEKRAFVSAVLMATGASDIFTQDLEDIPILSFEGPPPVQPEKGSPELPGGGGEATLGLSAKREPWLLRVAREGQVGPDGLQRCLDYLRVASPKKVTEFFDQMARTKGAVFAPFLNAS